MSIAGMVIWALTAGIGIYLLAVGIGAQRAAGLARAQAAAAAGASQARSGTAGSVAATADRAAAGVTAAADSTDGASQAMGTQALAVVLGGGQAPVAAPVDGSPLLEFTHPALALLGLTFWIFFVMTGYRLFAWIAFGVVVATMVAGLSWELSRRRMAARRGGGGPGGTAAGPRFPAHLVLVHGAAAACTFALVVIAAAVASGHG